MQCQALRFDLFRAASLNLDWNLPAACREEPATSPHTPRRRPAGRAAVPDAAPEGLAQ